jgi:carboxylesterase type B
VLIAKTGQSAGAGSIVQHLVAYNGHTEAALKLRRPLFQNAIVISVFLPEQLPYNSAVAETTYDSLAHEATCTGSDDEVFQCLSSVDSYQLAQAAQRVSIKQPYDVVLLLPVLN